MFTIYSKPNCSYCDQAKALLQQKKLSYNEIVLDIGQVHEDNVTYLPVAEFKRRYPDAKTVPQIFESKKPNTDELKLIGGFTELRSYLSQMSAPVGTDIFNILDAHETK